jgi:hypothetical protein
VSNTWTTYASSGGNVTYSSSTATLSSGSNSIWTSSTPSNIYCGDIVLADGSKLSDLVKSIPFTLLPPGLDLENPSVMDLVKRWYQALEQLKLAHEQLMTISNLTENHANE